MSHKPLTSEYRLTALQAVPASLVVIKFLKSEFFISIFMGSFLRVYLTEQITASLRCLCNNSIIFTLKDKQMVLEFTILFNKRGCNEAMCSVFDCTWYL